MTGSFEHGNVFLDSMREYKEPLYHLNVRFCIKIPPVSQISVEIRSTYSRLRCVVSLGYATRLIVLHISVKDRDTFEILTRLSILCWQLPMTIFLTSFHESYGQDTNRHTKDVLFPETVSLWRNCRHQACRLRHVLAFMWAVLKHSVWQK